MSRLVSCLLAAFFLGALILAGTIDTLTTY